MTTHDERPLLILDLDETLIYATRDGSGVSGEFVVGPYHVSRRPYLDQFLSTVNPAFQLAVWSSSTSDYVAGIVRNIFPAEFTLRLQWGRTRCVQRYDPELQDYYWVKDLKKVRRLGYDLNQVLVVDDSPEKLERNYGNIVCVTSFTGDESDRELQRLGPYLVSLAGSSNFRTIEKRDWRLAGTGFDDSC